MAIHAAVGALDADGLSGERQVEDVIDAAERGIEGDDFDAGAGDVADVEVFAEKEGAWVLRSDEAELEAGGGKDEHLRGGGHVEGFEQAEEAGAFAGGVEREASAFEVGFDAREAVGERASPVVVRGFFKRGIFRRRAGEAEGEEEDARFHVVDSESQIHADECGCKGARVRGGYDRGVARMFTERAKIHISSIPRRARLARWV